VGGSPFRTNRRSLAMSALMSASAYFRLLPPRLATCSSIASIKQSHFTPPRSVTSLVSRAGGFPKAPAPVPPVCSPFADAFQRLLTAHEKPGVYVVCLPAIRAFQRHSTQHLLHYSQVSFRFSLLFPQCPVRFLFNALGVVLAAQATHTRSGGLPPCT
jgi:hypothetical protein